MFDFKTKLPYDMKASPYPFMNESIITSDWMTTRPLKTYDDLDYWIERTPEAIAIINAIITDIKSDGFRFEGATINVNKAKHFIKTNFFAEEYFAFLWDWIKYGDAYMWIGGVEKVLKIQEKLTTLEIDIDEDFPRMIKHVPANTMDILHDGKKIIGFKQNVRERQDQPINYSVKDIIHGKLLPNKGKVYGFSPSQASLTEMNVIGYLKDYAATFFKNGGVPDWMFVLPNEMAGSPNHKRLIEMLRKYKHPVNKHGNLVFAGEVTAEKLGTGLQDLDINDLAIYFVSVLALAHNMPVSRVAALIGSKVRVSTGGDDLANEGYWSKISEHQDRLETWFNTQLFEPYFKVRLITNKAWKSNEIKEQQRNQFAIGNINSLNSQLMRYDKQLKLDWIKRQLYLTDDDLEKANEEFNQIQQSIQGKQPDNFERDRGTATESLRKQKREQIPQEQKLEMKGKLTHLVNKELFFEKFQHWVKQSETRNLYYYIQNGVIHATIATPDENFILETAVSELNEIEISEIKQFGNLTQGLE